MWSHSAIRAILSQNNAHEQLMQRKMARVYKKKEWINAYEFGLFTDESTTRLMGETLHIHGMVMSDVVAPFIHQLACVRGYEKNVRAMERFVWNIPVVRGIIRRPDSYILMTEEYGLNAYEYTILHDRFMSGEIGRMMKYHRIPIYKVIRYDVFKKSPQANIKALLTI